MKFFQSLHGVESEQLTELALHAEQLGFEGVTFGDHLVKPAAYANEYLYFGGRSPTLGPPQISRTGRRRTRTRGWRVPRWDRSPPHCASSRMSTCLPMRHPVHVAKQLATADVFARGRIILGIGAGWLREEFDLVDVSFDERGARTDEMLEIIRLLLSGRDVEFNGRVFLAAPGRMRPVPTQRVPVMIVATATLRCVVPLATTDGSVSTMKPNSCRHWSPSCTAIDESLVARTSHSRSSPYRSKE